MGVVRATGEIRLCGRRPRLKEGAAVLTDARPQSGRREPRAPLRARRDPACIR